MSKPLRIGTLGAAAITPSALITPASENRDVVVAAVAARDRARAEAFASRHLIDNVYDSYDEVINDASLDAIYNPLPISHHHEYSIKALRAGKHVLCEKSLALNAHQAEEMAEVARETGLVLMEAFHYRYHPCFLRALEIVDSGVLGKLERIEARFVIGMPEPADIRMHYETGGGATMDVGCYPISWLRHITRREPTVVAATARVGNPGVDLQLAAEYAFSDGLSAETVGSMCAERFAADMSIRGADGQLRVVNPLAPQFGSRLEISIGAETTVEQPTRRPSYSFQLEAFVAAVRRGTSLPTDAEDAVKQMRIIDAVYRAAGLPPR